MTTVDRDFWHMNERTILPYLEGLFDVLETAVQDDKRSRLAPSETNKWLSVVGKKR